MKKKWMHLILISITLVLLCGCGENSTGKETTENKGVSLQETATNNADGFWSTGIPKKFKYHNQMVSPDEKGIFECDGEKWHIYKKGEHDFAVNQLYENGIPMYIIDDQEKMEVAEDGTFLRKGEEYQYYIDKNGKVIIASKEKIEKLKEESKN